METGKIESAGDELARKIKIEVLKKKLRNTNPEFVELEKLQAENEKTFDKMLDSINNK